MRQILRLTAMVAIAMTVVSLPGCSDDSGSEAPGRQRTVDTRTVTGPATPVDGKPTPSRWLKKHVKQREIPFDAVRKQQMADYSLRHYGESKWRLVNPKLIVIHFAVADTLDSIWSTFAGNNEHNGEPPNTCAHFAVDGAGEIIQMVDTSTRCRHVIGLNDVAIGIEHTGFSDSEVLENKREMRASLGLTAALRCENRLPVSAVIGHSESPESPYFHQNDPHATLGVHSDFTKEAMDRYRARLKALPPCSEQFSGR